MQGAPNPHKVSAVSGFMGGWKNLPDWIREPDIEKIKKEAGISSGGGLNSSSCNLPHPDNRPA